MNTSWNRRFIKIAALINRGCLLLITMLLLLEALPAAATPPGRVSQSDFDRLTISFEPYSLQKTGGLIAKDDVWVAYSNEFGPRDRETQCKPKATAAGGLLMNIGIFVRMPQLDQSIVPFSDDQANEEVIEHLKKLLAPVLSRYCKGAGEKIDLWVGFMFIDVVSTTSVLSYHLTWTDGNLIARDKDAVNWRTYRNPAELTKRGFLKYLSGGTYYYRLLGEELPDATLPAISAGPATSSTAQTGAPTKVPLRSENYWLRFNNSEMGSIFNGRLPDANNNVIFMENFRRFQARLFYSCPSMVPKDSPAIYYEKTTKFGATGLEIKQESERIKIRSSRWDAFKDAADKLTKVYSRFDFSNPMANVRFAVKTITSVNSDIDLFFKENACDSETLMQFDENLFRLATGKDPIRINRAGASNSADTEKPTFAVACYLFEKKLSDNARKRNPSEFFDADRKRTWCNCLEREFKGVVPLPEMEAAISDFSIVSRWIDPPEEPNNPRWPRVYASYRCQNKYR